MDYIKRLTQNNFYVKNCSLYILKNNVYKNIMELIPETSSGQALILLLKREGLIGAVDVSLNILTNDKNVMI